MKMFWDIINISLKKQNDLHLKLSSVVLAHVFNGLSQFFRDNTRFLLDTLHKLKINKFFSSNVIYVSSSSLSEDNHVFHIVHTENVKYILYVKEKKFKRFGGSNTETMKNT